MNEIDEKNQAPVQQECLKEMIQNGHARRMGSVEDLYVALKDKTYIGTSAHMEN